MTTLTLKKGQVYWIGEGAKRTFYNSRSMVPGVATLRPANIPINVDAYQMEQLEDEDIELDSENILDTAGNVSNAIVGGRPKKARRK